MARRPETSKSLSSLISTSLALERLLQKNEFRCFLFFCVIHARLYDIVPQIAIAIGVLTSNRGGGDEPLWRIGRGTRVPLQGAVDVVPLLGAIVGCHCSVLWLRGRVTTNFGVADVVPLLGAIAGCHCSVLWWGEGRATTNFGGADVVPLLSVCCGGGRGWCHCKVPL